MGEEKKENITRSVTERDDAEKTKVVAIVHVSFHPVPSRRSRARARRRRRRTDASSVRARLGLFRGSQTLKRIRQPHPRRAADADIDAERRRTNEFDSESFIAVIGRHPSSSSARRGRARRRPRIPPHTTANPRSRTTNIRPSVRVRPRTRRAAPPTPRRIEIYVIRRTVHAHAHRRRRRSRRRVVVVVRTYPLFLHKTCVVERRSRTAEARN